MALILLFSGFKRVHIVIPNDLMIRDKEEFENYWAITNMQERVQYHEDFKFEKKNGDILICDEADLVLFADP